MDKTNEVAAQSDRAARDWPKTITRGAFVIIGAASFAATSAALAESYRGLHAWAIIHDVPAGFFADIWPLILDLPVLVGEAALLVGTLNGWRNGWKVAAWFVTGVGLAASIAANAWHMHDAGFWSRASAGAAPLVAFGLLGVAVGVIKHTLNPGVPKTAPKTTATVVRKTPKATASTVPVTGQRSKYREQDHELTVELATLIKAGAPVPKARTYAREQMGDENLRNRATRIIRNAERIASNGQVTHA